MTRYHIQASKWRGARSITALAVALGWIFASGAFAQPSPPRGDGANTGPIAKGIFVQAADFWGKGNPRLAVFPFSGASTADGAAFADQLLAKVKPDQYEMYDKAMLLEKASGNQYSSESLAKGEAAPIRLGRLIGVRYLVVGSFVHDREYNLSVRMYDCKDGVIMHECAARFDGPAQSDDAFTNLAADLKLREDRPAPHKADTGLLAAVNDGFKVSIEIVPGKEVFDEGESVSFIITVPCDCYITLIGRDCTGAETYLVPNPWQLDQVHAVAGGKQLRITVPAPEAGFTFPIQAPHGQTIVKVIATTKQLELSTLDRAKMQQAAAGIGEKFLTKAIGNAKSIGLVGAPGADNSDGVAIGDLLQPEEWATAQVSFITRPREKAAN